MPVLELRGLSKRYGETVAVDDASLTVADGEIVALLGPSGSGKSTVLRIVAGLETEHEGSVLLDGLDLRGLPANERDFGLMFQDLALFPHMDVYGNVSFGLRMLGVPKAEQRRRVGALLELVGLSGKERRSIFELSGGERQRVALARSLAPEPALLMLDEPLGALDRTLRESLATEVRDVLKSVGLSGLYVTHDQEEALSIGDRVAVMRAGRIVQTATPADLLRAPATEFVARFLGYQNLIPLDGALARRMAAEGGNGVLLIPEEAVEMGTSGDVQGTVTGTRRRGRMSDVWVAAEGELVHLMVSSAEAEELEEGEAVALTIDRSRVHPISDEDQTAVK
ncbi:MAG TPA: ABC transporter ATP-binding protein [Dehalococcoidia bacterium]|nr:ABC transporter ATP-binding protein [Dehalococcoidia bacterium]